MNKRVRLEREIENINRRKKNWLFLAWLGALLMQPSVVHAGADDVRSQLPANWQWEHSVPQSVEGIYAVCRALGQLGVNVEPVSLWNSQVVGEGKHGMTPDELIAVTEKYGCRGHEYRNLSLLEFQAVGDPVIAKVRRNFDSNEYDHWVCVQASGDRLIVFDGADSSREVEPAEFLASFSGIGVVISGSDSSWYLARLARFGGVIAFLSIGWFGLAFRAPEQTTVAQQLLRISVVTLAMMVTGLLVFNTAAGYGKGNRIAVAPFSRVEVRQGEMQDLTAANLDKSILLVDTRRADAFSIGSLDRAVNIPVNANYYAIRDFVKKLDRDVPIVLFCQGAG